MNRWRHFTLLTLLLLGTGALAARVTFLTTTDREFLQQQGDARSIRTVAVPAYRGAISDRHGEPLAVSTPVVSFWTDPSRHVFTDDQVRTLSRVLVATPDGERAERLRSRLKAASDREFLYLRRRMPWSQAQAVRASLQREDLRGIYEERSYRRYYPAAQTAAHVVGMTNVDDAGLEGVELSFEERLRGVDGRKVVQKDRRGHTIEEIESLAHPRNGTELALTLDMRLQYFAYRELKAAVASHQALSGSVVMLDARSGEILALANEPSYNPNEPVGDDLSRMRNRAVTDQYEPGSLVKPFTVVAAFESTRYEPGTVIDTTPGYFQVRGKLIQDPVNRGRITLTETLQKSSQVGIAKVALDLEDTAVLDVLRRVGVADYVGSGLPGEKTGTVNAQSLDNPINKATLAYGYGLAVSPLQIAQAYAVLANHGVRVQPRIANVVASTAPQRVIDSQIADRVVRMMRSVAAVEGTGNRARVDGYAVAGKTGTARKVGARGYDDERHVALFAGIVPADDPRLVIVVVVDEPQGDVFGGGDVAAPVFARVAMRSLRMLGVPPMTGEAS